MGVNAQISNMDHRGQGVARIEGKATFVQGALPGELVSLNYQKRSKRFDQARVAKVIQPSAERCPPRCQVYEQCGGCQLQHCQSQAQLQYKQQAVAELMQRVAGVQPQHWLPILQGDPWQYRRRARLHVTYTTSGVVLGFRQSRQHRVVSALDCPVLTTRLRQLLPGLLPPLAAFPKAVTEVLLLDVSQPGVWLQCRQAPKAMLALWQQWAEAQQVVCYLQAGETVHTLWQPEGGLYDQVGAYRIGCTPRDFLQANGPLNQALVQQVVAQLDPQPGEAILELFAGLGNFSLPLVGQGAQVLALEGDAEMVARGNATAESNGVASQLCFQQVDLTQPLGALGEQAAGAKWLLDPPRSGAAMMMQEIGRYQPQRVVYVACDPATLARDLGVLREQGYTLEALGIVDMFPHTQHIETLAVIQRG